MNKWNKEFYLENEEKFLTAVQMYKAINKENIEVTGMFEGDEFMLCLVFVDLKNDDATEFIKSLQDFNETLQAFRQACVTTFDETVAKVFDELIEVSSDEEIHG
jgi:hypothetical protein